MWLCWGHLSPWGQTSVVCVCLCDVVSLELVVATESINLVSSSPLYPTLVGSLHSARGDVLRDAPGVSSGEQDAREGGGVFFVGFGGPSESTVGGGD